MTTIAGYTDGILDGTIPPERQEHYLRIIADESRRLSRLVRHMRGKPKSPPGMGRRPISVRHSTRKLPQTHLSVLLAFQTTWGFS
jgi:hypothetical protein